MLSETVVLFGKGLYKTIPDSIKLSAVPTASELEYVGAEDFDSTMLNTIFPEVIEDSEGMDFKELLEVDYDWICRCLRMKSYGPFFNTNRIFCSNCDKVHRGDYTVDLRNVGVNLIPEGFINRIAIDSDEFIDFKDNIVMHLMTMQDHLAMQKDTAFDRKNGSKDVTLARMCYSIKQIGLHENMTPLDVRAYIKNNMSSADYEILKSIVNENDNYGLQFTGSATCPVCGSTDAYFIALQQDKFFRPTVGDLRNFKQSIRQGDWEKLPGDPARYVR